MSESKNLPGKKYVGRRPKDGVAKPEKRPAEANQPAAKPVSLAPLSFEDAVRGLLAVEPQKEGKGGKPR